MIDLKGLEKHLDYSAKCYGFENYENFVNSNLEISDKSIKSKLILQLAELKTKDEYIKNLEMNNQKRINFTNICFILIFFLLSILLIITTISILR